MKKHAAPIGVFDSGYGGLTVFKEIVKTLPQYDYIYLGDNARVPYGSRSFETVYKYTRECVNKLFEMGCRLVILACNTASAKALRSIQQKDLSQLEELHKVLGVIRPTAEIAGELTKTGNVGVLATQGTVASESYKLEIKKFFPDIQVFQQACPMWVPLIEHDEYLTPGASYFIKKNVEQLMALSPAIDTILLACTHYPLLADQIKAVVGPKVEVVSQGEIVATSLNDYLKRHPEVEELCSAGSSRTFYTTESTTSFDEKASIFLGHAVESKYLAL